MQRATCRPRAPLGGYDTIIWDWNGTLLDDLQLCLEIANELLDEHGIAALSRERYRAIFDFPVQLYYERAGLRLDGAAFSELSARFCALFEQRIHRAPLFACATRVIRQLRARGARQFVLSNTEQGSLERLLDRYGLRLAFDAVQGRQDTLALGKLDAGRALLQQGRIETDKTVLIGDTLHDAEVARQLGVDCVLVAAGHQSAERLSNAECRVVDTLDVLAGPL